MTNYNFTKSSRGDGNRGIHSRDRGTSASRSDWERTVRGGQERERAINGDKNSHAPPLPFHGRSRSDTDDGKEHLHLDECGHNDEGNVQTYFKEHVRAEHIPPPTATSMVGQYVSSAQSTASSVSSMTSKDSYVRQQMFLRDMEWYKRVLRESGRHFGLIGEEEQQQQEGNIEEGYGKEEEHFIQVKCEDEDESSLFQDENHQFWKAGGDGLEVSFSVNSSDRDDLNQDEDEATYSVGSRGGSNRQHTVSTSSRARASTTPSTPSQKRGAKVTTPVYQLEECCIKHPHVLLQDQTELNVWTCMRYCKDPRTGRWLTVKKVCTQCLREMDDSYDEENWSQHASMHGRSRSTRSSEHKHHSHEYGISHFTEETWSNNSEDEKVDHPGHDNSIYNVYGDDGNQTPLEREAEAQRRRFIRRLAARAYHFPGNSWFEDWLQYTKNTHLVFGIFFHHPLHPVTSKERCIILLGSVAVGLLLSNLIYLWFVEADFGMHDTVLTLGPNGNVTITKLMITLWTLGSFVHTIFDLSIWHIKACTLCRLYGSHVSDKAVKFGRGTGVTIVLFTLAFATYLVLLRASEDFKAASDGEDTDDSFFHSIVLGGGAKYFDFTLGYLVEFIVAVFVYSPLILTVVFSGILGCDGKIPILGGRPREVAKEQRYAMKRQRYIMPRTLKLGDKEYEADLWCDQKLATNF